MRVFLERRFKKWVEKEGIEDARLVETAMEAFAGQYEADLGGYLFKKRLAREGEGKSGGYRTILCFRKADDDRIFFLYGFAKGVKENIDSLESRALKKLAAGLLSVTDAQIDGLLDKGFLKKIGEVRDEAEE
ncbi:type II toxin-antitoxin system RelE/ParE family toxin [Tabrizicola sp.]|uniref:type II toxin-antitoxin system RelE/ParE family toxin n=1 Tax=Tabrizicola sp. TaxID=2005166 RepID=UPI002FDE9181